jgi:hypothetical protein
MKHDLTGQRFGRLQVVGPAHVDRHGNRHWSCRCDCGTEITKVRGNLVNGWTKSCGCLQREVGKNNRTHGMRHTPEYEAWCNMRGRCFDPKNSAYKRYGGRGIMVCKRWLKFENFIADMGLRPSPKHSLDREDNDGNYTPKNCRWATKKQQNDNTSQNRWLTLHGVTRTISDWSKHTGIRRLTIGWRLDRGWSAERALTTPTRPIRRSASS